MSCCCCCSCACVQQISYNACLGCSAQARYILYTLYTHDAAAANLLFGGRDGGDDTRNGGGTTRTLRGDSHQKTGGGAAAGGWLRRQPHRTREDDRYISAKSVSQITRKREAASRQSSSYVRLEASFLVNFECDGENGSV